MVANILQRVIGSRNERLLRRFRRTVSAVNELESGLRERSDTELAAATAALRGRRTSGEPVETLIPEAFALVREAGRRTLEMRHFDVQLIGGLVLHEGRIAEMRTGEGKTLVATLSAVLNALGGDSVHIVTVNDYLARRDAEWMGHIYSLLGMTVGVVVPGQTPGEKREAYLADIVYGTNNEFGFDYLRDNMAFSMAEKAQPRLAYAIVDEVDSILIDEARTPLIISGPSEESSELYLRINRLIPKLERQEREPEDTSSWPRSWPRWRRARPLRRHARRRGPHPRRACRRHRPWRPRRQPHRRPASPSPRSPRTGSSAPCRRPRRTLQAARRVRRSSIASFSYLLDRSNAVGCPMRFAAARVSPRTRQGQRRLPGDRTVSGRTTPLFAATRQELGTGRRLRGSSMKSPSGTRPLERG